MRVAALYDVHGNLPALTAVLAEVDELSVDAIVVGGDVACGPMPVETLDALRARDARFVRGNADRVLDLRGANEAETCVRPAVGRGAPRRRAPRVPRCPPARPDAQAVGWAGSGSATALPAATS